MLGLASNLPNLGNLHQRGDVELHGENTVVKHGLVILVDGRLSVLWLLVDHGGRAEELAELVSVELALLQLADLREQSL